MEDFSKLARYAPDDVATDAASRIATAIADTRMEVGQVRHGFYYWIAQNTFRL